jgi:hypothetical protein
MQKKEIIAWRCSQCGTAIMPEEVVSHALTSVSGHDVVTVAHCSCGNSALLSWSMADWHRLHQMRTKQLATLDEQEQHKKASEIGRKVAEFRNDLEAGDTLADWGLM